MDARVIYKYEKDQDDELNLNIGDYLVEVVKADDGWCEGTLKSTGVRGMFPDNFVELIPVKPPPAAVVTQPPPPVENPPIRDTADSKKRRAKVTYSYTADNEDELSLDPGQIVEVLEEEEEGWWRGMLNGKEGVFPSNFVEPIAIEEVEEVMPPPPVPKENKRPPSMIAMPGLGGVNPLELKRNLKPVASKPQPPPPILESNRPPPPFEPAKPPPDRPRSNTGSRMSRPLQKAKVMFTYDASHDDEISVSEGEIVDIVTKDTDQDGWWKIKKGSREGLVPENFLEEKGAPPDSKEHPPLPPKKVEAPKPAPPIPGAKSVLPRLPDKTETPPEKPVPPPPTSANEPPMDELEVPHNGVLDNSKIKQRPKKISARPPSRGNLNVEDDAIKKPESPPPVDDKPDDTSGMAPWQKEQKNKKAGVKAAVPTPIAPASTTTNNTKPPPTAVPITRPKPTRASKPLPQTTPKPSALTGSGTTTNSSGIGTGGGVGGKSVSTGALQSSTSSTTARSSEPKFSDIQESSGEWKEAFESLKKEFQMFKEELKEDMRILTEDLDNERKKNAQLQVDVDRLKKTAGFREKL